jgi:hypothetical protein
LPHRATALAIAAQVLGSKVPEVADELESELNRFFPELEARQNESMHLQRSIRDNLRNIFTMFEDGIDASDSEPPPSALYWPRHMAHQGVTVDLLTRVYYVGHSMIWEKWLFPEIARAASSTEELIEAAHHAHAQLFQYLDRAALKVARHFEDERLLSSSSASAHLRSQTVFDAISDRGTSPSAFDALNYNISASHIAFICWSGLDEPGSKRLMDLATDVAATLSPRRRLIVTHDSREVWGWVQVDHHLKDYQLPSLRILANDSGFGAHIAIGEVGSGLDGFRRSHADAQRVQELVATCHRSAPTVSSYSDVALASLLTADRRGALEFSNRQLRDLAGDSKELVDLRETVRAFIETHGSYSRTAELMTIHRNTVLYRIQKAEALVGKGILDSAAELHDALIVADWIGNSSSRP